MTYDQVLPAVAKMQQALWLTQWSAYRAAIGLPLPKRRRKLKTIPGVLDTSDGEAG